MTSATAAVKKKEKKKFIKAAQENDMTLDNNLPRKWQKTKNFQR